MQAYVYQCGLHSPLVVPSRESPQRRLADEPAHFFDYLADATHSGTKHSQPRRENRAASTIGTAATTTDTSPSVENQEVAHYQLAEDLTRTDDTDVLTAAPCDATHNESHVRAHTATTNHSTASPSPIAPPSYSTSAIDCSMWTLPNRVLMSVKPASAVASNEEHDPLGETATMAAPSCADTASTRPDQGVSRPRRFSFSSLLQPSALAATGSSTCHSTVNAGVATGQPRNPDSDANDSRSAEASADPMLMMWSNVKGVRFAGRSMTPSGSLGTTTSHGVSLSADAADRSELSFAGCGGCSGFDLGVVAARQSAQPHGLSTKTILAGGTSSSPHGTTLAPPAPAHVAHSHRELLSPAALDSSNSNGNDDSPFVDADAQLDEVRALFQSSDDDNEDDGENGLDAGEQLSQRHTSPMQSSQSNPTSAILSGNSSEDDHCVTVHDLAHRFSVHDDRPTPLTATASSISVNAAVSQPNCVPLSSPALPPPATTTTTTTTVTNSDSLVHSLIATSAGTQVTASVPVNRVRDCGLVFSALSRSLQATTSVNASGLLAPSLPQPPSCDDAHDCHDVAEGRELFQTPNAPIRAASWSPSPLQQHCLRRLTMQPHYGMSCGGGGGGYGTPDAATARTGDAVWPAHTPLARSVASTSVDGGAGPLSTATRSSPATASTASSMLPTPVRCGLYRGSSCPVKSTPHSPGTHSAAHATGANDDDEDGPREPTPRFRSPADDPVHTFTGFPTPIKFSPIPTKMYAPVMNTPFFDAPVHVILRDDHEENHHDHHHHQPFVSTSQLTAATDAPTRSMMSPAAADVTMRPTSAATLLFGPSTLSYDDTTNTTANSLLAGDQSVRGDDDGRPASAARTLDDPAATVTTTTTLTPPHANLTVTDAADVLDDTTLSYPALSPLGSKPTVIGRSISPVTLSASPSLTPPVLEEAPPVIRISIPGLAAGPQLVTTTSSPSLPIQSMVCATRPVLVSPSPPRTPPPPPPPSVPPSSSVCVHVRPVRAPLLSPSPTDAPSLPDVSVKSLVASAMSDRPLRRACTPRPSPVSMDSLLRTEVPVSSGCFGGRQPSVSQPSAAAAYLRTQIVLGERSATTHIDSWL